MELHNPLQPNPVGGATWFSKYCSYWWLNDLFKKGNKQILQTSDIYDILPEEDTKNVTDKLHRIWQNETKMAAETGRKARLWRAILKFLGFRNLAIGFLFFAQESFRTVRPLFIGKLLTYFSSVPGLSRLEAYLYALALIISSFGSFFLNRPSLLMCQRLAVQLRIAIGGLVYQKVMRLSHGSLGKITTGHVINILTTDVKKIELGCDLLNYLWITPALVIVAVYLSWQELGPSCISGILLLSLTAPIQTLLGKRFAKLRQKTAELTDERVSLMNEIISGMRVIKMYTWEEYFAKLVAKVKSSESKVIKKTAYVRAIIAAFSITFLSLISLLVFTTYVMMGNDLTPKKVFVVLGVFMSIEVPVTIRFPRAIRCLKEGFVSVKRVQKLLEMEEKTQTKLFSKKISILTKAEIPKVKVTNVTASWDENLSILKDINFELNPGELLIVVGPVGCGKSSLLMALLGEVPLSKGDLQVQGRIGYASQQPWVFSGTVKENIIFGQDFDSNRYTDVIKACALQRDLKLFPRGDSSLVGERGVVLSGGQKARISLARAAYYDSAKVFLLDDPLSAVDTHVGKQLFEECICGLLRDKIVILVTHQLQYLKKATSILCLKDGCCVGLGTYSELSAGGLDLMSLISAPDTGGDGAFEPDIEKLRHADRQDTNSPSYKITNRDQLSSNLSMATSGDLFELPIQDPLKSEEYDRTTGKVTWSVYGKYVRHGGGPILLTTILLLMVGLRALFMTADWWLAHWADSEEKEAFERESSSNLSTSSSLHSRTVYISVYSSLMVGGFITSVVAIGLFYHVAVSASQNLHDVMFRRVLRAPIHFFDTNPVGRVLNRFSKDVYQMDDMLPDVSRQFSQLAILALSILLLNVVSIPYLLLVIVPVLAVLLYVRNYYLKTSREVKRLEAICRSPFYSHLSASINGLMSIRAFKAEDRFVEMYNCYQNFHTSAWFICITTSHWLASRLDFLCCLSFSAITLAVLFITEAGVSISAGLVGLCLTYAQSLTGMLQWCIRQSIEVENLMTSVERVMEYSKLEQEADLHTDDELPKGWPELGTITSQRLDYSHHHDLPLVLKNINFSIKSKEKVGIVGRTGAGKSSLLAALFRFAEPNGLLEIDGVSTTDIGLHDLRSKISTIPQDPVLFSGSLRRNLDPLNEHEDLEIWKVLEEVQLKEAVDELTGGLYTKLAEGGSNFSVGQRQLVCLARAVLRQNRILIIDEATANVDQNTDALIQETIRLKFKDCTVLTIAHRLLTIMDSDRVMVLDEGRLVEFDEPYVLLQNKDSLFTQLVEQTNKSAAAGLYVVARTAYKSRHPSSTNSIQETTQESVSGDSDGDLLCDLPSIIVPDVAKVVPDVTITGPEDGLSLTGSSLDAVVEETSTNASDKDPAEYEKKRECSRMNEEVPLMSVIKPSDGLMSRSKNIRETNENDMTDATETDKLII